jgi:kynurenine formamidase
MKIRIRLLAASTLAAAFSIGLPVTFSPFSQAAESNHDSNTRVTEADLLEWFDRFSNKGRWENVGLGAANLITPSKRRAAARLVTRGISVSMGHNESQEPCAPTGCVGDQDDSYLKRTVLNPQMGPFISDRYEYQGTYHFGATGQPLGSASHSHLDALGCHIHFEGEGWNNRDIDVTQENGCSAEQGGIIALKDGVFTRGVIIDIPRFRNVQWLEAGQGVTGAEIRRWERWSRVKIRPGDAIFLRTGRWKRQSTLGVPYRGGSPGWHASVIPFLYERDVAYIGSDHVNDVLPPGVLTTRFILPVHQIVMPSLGINIFDNLDLEALSDLANRLNRFEFLLTVGPLRVDKGTGSPINPIATF